jgi:hypothetical protein
MLEFAAALLVWLPRIFDFSLVPMAIVLVALAL